MDVLESIENGLEHERKRGTLDHDELEVRISLFPESIGLTYHM